MPPETTFAVGHGALPLAFIFSGLEVMRTSPRLLLVTAGGAVMAGVGTLFASHD